MAYCKNFPNLVNQKESIKPFDISLISRKTPPTSTNQCLPNMTQDDYFPPKNTFMQFFLKIYHVKLFFGFG